MQITNLDHLHAIDSKRVEGGSVPGDTISLSWLQGLLSLKQGETVLFEQPIALPHTISLNLEGASVVASRSTTETVNGVTNTTHTISVYPANTPLSSFGFHPDSFFGSFF